MNISLKKNKEMVKTIIILIVLSVSTCSLFSQNRTIKGRVISEFFETLPEVSIIINDTVEVGKTDLNGFFQIDIPIFEKKILFRAVGLEPATIELVDKCDEVEVVMMLISSADFVSMKRAERKRKKRYEKLPEIHKQAFEKGVFETKYACYNREFEPFYLKSK
ncbi:hypothetical protein SDC9_124197 [bioreactor metagenome]|uniref:TonB-dependent receptor SusC n=1 Tax=bioreactor metagenome TaxID=1076179 RepID=A0A645CJS0_9ZZZZ